MNEFKIEKERLDYSKYLYEQAILWYKNADSKAQILLSIDGAFVAFLTGSVFSKSSELKNILIISKTDTWIFLILMCLCLVISIVCALYCLRSRIYSMSDLNKLYNKQGINIKDADSYSPEVMLFFQLISGLDPKQFIIKLNMLDLEFITETFGIQIHHLSGNVCAKHRWVNYGFFFAGFTLILFLSGTISYVVRVS